MKIPILMYHEIASQESFDALSTYINRKYIIGNASFEKQLLFLRSNSYQTFTVSDLLNVERIPEKTVVLTFDDGHAGNFTYAFTLLKKYGFRATFFLATDLIGRMNMLNWEEIREMSKNGMEIGSHTCSHLLLASEKENKIRQELQKSKEIIEKNTGKPVRSLSYPNGSYSPFISEIAKDYNYQNACTSDYGYWNSESKEFNLPRIISPEAENVFKKIIERDVVNMLSNNASECGKRTLKILLGDRLYNSIYMRLFNLKDMTCQ